jgi:sensor histidine kinase YesM
MKLRKREFDIFNLSFLDVISCGFGAVVMLVLISKTNDDVSIIGKGEVEGLLKTVISLENAITELEQTIIIQLSKSDQLSNEKKRLETTRRQANIARR